MCVIHTVAEDGKVRKMVMLPIEYLNGWLFGVDANRVNAESKDKVIEYQKECFRVLANHFMPKQNGLKQIPRELPKAPRAKTYIKGGLQKYQQDEINDMIGLLIEGVEHDKRAKTKIMIYSAINTKFGTKGMKHGYKNIPEEQFENVTQLIARLPLDGQLLPSSTPLVEKEGLQISFKVNSSQVRYLVNNRGGEVTLTQLDQDTLVFSREALKKNIVEVCPGYKMIPTPLYNKIMTIHSEIKSLK